MSADRGLTIAIRAADGRIVEEKTIAQGGIVRLDELRDAILHAGGDPRRTATDETERIRSEVTELLERLRNSMPNDAVRPLETRLTSTIRLLRVLDSLAVSTAT